MLNIEERTICANLETVYPNISFKRKFKIEIRTSLLNFIQFKLNSFLIEQEKNNFSPINLFNSGLNFLSQHFIFSTSSTISFENISFIKDDFFNSYKDDLFSSINPNYYESISVPHCLKNKKNIDISQNFVLSVALYSFFEKTLYLNRINANISLESFSEIISPYLKPNTVIPDKFNVLILNDLKKLFYHFKTLSLIYDLKGSFQHNGVFRDTILFRDINSNYEQVFESIEPSSFNLSREDFYRFYGKVNYHVPNSIKDPIIQLCFDFVVFLFHNLDFKKSYELYSPHYPLYFKREEN
jgi:hypothetical protein